MSSLDTSSLIQVAPMVPPAPETDGEGGTLKERRYKLHRRFDRLGRLYGDDGVKLLINTRVVIFGLGGVGSFAAEAIARSAVGSLSLVDFDDVCVTNSNRQLQALKGTVGQSKAELLAERCRLINPQANVHWERLFYNAERSDALLTPPWEGVEAYDFVIDCIDNLTAKAHLIATCKEKGIPLISSMGAAGKLDPTQVKIADLAETRGCKMAREMRSILRKKHGFPQEGPMGVSAVFSEEKRTWPRLLEYDGGEGFKCICPHVSDEHGCDSRNLIDGTAVFVTGTFGLVCASHVINTLARPLIEQAPKAKA